MSCFAVVALGRQLVPHFPAAEVLERLEQVRRETRHLAFVVRHFAVVDY